MDTPCVVQVHVGCAVCPPPHTHTQDHHLLREFLVKWSDTMKKMAVVLDVSRHLTVAHMALPVAYIQIHLPQPGHSGCNSPEHFYTASQVSKAVIPVV